MIINSKKLLQKAYREKYAVGHFNINNLEVLQAVISACEKMKSPAIIATSEGAIKYAGHELIFNMIKTVVEKSKIPFSIHLDHGRNIDVIKKSIKLGYTSIMIDESYKNFEENVRLTKKVVNLCHKKSISVEAELGTIGGSEDLISEKRIILTNPEDAKEFIEKTGIDCLAIAIGTSHGAYKFKGKAKLDLKRLKKINKLCKIPLVLHGASEVPKKYFQLANKYGAKLERLQGVPVNQLKQAIKYGVSKVNTDTDLKIAFNAGLRKFLAQNKKNIDLRATMNAAKKLVQEAVERRIKQFGSKGKS